jgi:hypothetical protein
MIKQISKLKFIEYLIYFYLFFIITYDFIFPKIIADKIYEFGPVKLTIIVSATLIGLYFYLARNEKEYLKEKFSKRRIIISSIVSLLILILFFMSR